MTLMFVGLLSQLIRLVPKQSVESAGSASWLSPVAAFSFLTVFFLFILRFFKNRADGEGFADIIIRCCGKPIGKFLCLLFSFWLVLYSGFILRAGAERLLSTVYKNGDIFLFSAITAIIALFAALGKPHALARSAEIFYLILLTTLFSVFIFSASKINPENLLPVTPSDTVPVIIGSLPIINIVSVFIYPLFLSGYVKKSPYSNLKKTVVKRMLFFGIIVMLLMVCTIGVLGPEFLTQMQNPFFIMVKNITIFNIIERIEPAVIAIWVFADFIFLSTMFTVVSEIYKTVFETKSRTPFTPFCALAAFVVSLFIARDSFSLQKISELVIPAIHLSFCFGLIPLIFLIGRIRKKLR